MPDANLRCVERASSSADGAVVLVRTHLPLRPEPALGQPNGPDVRRGGATVTPRWHPAAQTAHTVEVDERRVPRGPHPPRPFRLVYVCTGNICRSPFAEILTRHLIDERVGDVLGSWFEISSAGVQAVVGAPMHELSRVELMPWHLDGRPASFRARQLLPPMVEQADLVLGMSRRHRATIARLVPAAMARTFGLLEFARLAAGVDRGWLPADPLARAFALPSYAAAMRGVVTIPPEGYSIPDPMGQDSSAHRAAATMIAAAVTSVVDIVAPPQR
jgi:protein-tyrosine phosphatase